MDFSGQPAKIQPSSSTRCTDMEEIKRAATLRPAQVRHVLRVTEATSRYPERDTLALVLGLTCAMRVTEIARLEVGDVLYPSGQVRKEVSLRAMITKGCKQRGVFLTHDRVVGAVDAYIEYLWKKRFGTELARDRYRGLSPQTTLLLTNRGGPLRIDRQTPPAGRRINRGLPRLRQPSGSCDGSVSGRRPAGMLRPFRPANLRHQADGAGPRHRGDPASIGPRRN